MLLSLTLGLSVALCWGTADIFSSHVVRLDSLRTTLCAQASGLFLLVMACVLILWLWPEVGTHVLMNLSPAGWVRILLFGIFLGALSAISYLTAYLALMRGPLSIVSPIMSMQGGVTLIGAVLLMHEPINSAQLIALFLLVCGVLAATLVAPPASDKIQHGKSRIALASISGIGSALIATVGFGSLGLGIGATTASSGIAGALAMLLCMRVFALFFLCIFASLFASSKQGPPLSRSWVLASLVGVLDMIALSVFSGTVISSSTALAGVLSSIYPAFTLTYGIIIRHERPTKTQIAGVLCIVVGLILLPLALPLRETLGIALVAIALVVGSPLLNDKDQGHARTTSAHTHPPQRAIDHTNYVYPGKIAPNGRGYSRERPEDINRGRH